MSSIRATMDDDYEDYRIKEVYVVNVTGNTYTIDTFEVIKECPKSYLVKIPGPSGKENDWTIKYLSKDKAQSTMLKVYVRILDIANDNIAHLKHMIDKYQKSIPQIEAMIEDVGEKLQWLELEYNTT
jgi:hypothetical protein